MIIFLNYINSKWKRFIYWFHDFSVKINVKWMVSLSIWMLNSLIWELPQKWQLINGKSVREYNLEMELELANHQIRYYMNYAADLQWQIINMKNNFEDQNKIIEKVQNV